MAVKKIGKRTCALSAPPRVIGYACIGGKKEGEGPLRDDFDILSDDSFFGQATWEKAESEMQRLALEAALDKAGLAPSRVDCVFAGDLLSQCCGSTFGLRDLGIPFWGVYGACSTMAQSLALAAMTIDGGFSDTAAAVTSSHYCSAERQFRFPLEYGGQRSPTSQWTATAAGAVVLASADAEFISSTSQNNRSTHITHITSGKIIDNGIVDTDNMGAAMAPAAYDTLRAHLDDTGRAPDYYDMILTGDLANFGSEILRDLFARDGVVLPSSYNDCGKMLYLPDDRDVESGASGCGCSASVLAGFVLRSMAAARCNRVLLVATGAMMSAVTSQQGESIPSIAYAVAIENL